MIYSRFSSIFLIFGATLLYQGKFWIKCTISQYAIETNNLKSLNYSNDYYEKLVSESDTCKVLSELNPLLYKEPSRKCFTIDGETAEALDDAISITPLWPVDHYEVGVHIIDVGNVIPADHELDQMAYSRKQTDDFKKMFDNPFICNEVFSLRESTSRIVFSGYFSLDCKEQECKIVNFRVVNEKVTISHSITYESANLLIAGKKSEFVEYMAHQKSKKYTGDQISNIYNDLNLLNDCVRKISFVADQSSALASSDSPSKFLITKLSILMNHHVAEFLGNALQNGILEEILLVTKQGFAAFSDLTTAKLPLSNLNVSYTYATSPARRYADIVVQRMLTAVLLSGNGGRQHTVNILSDSMCATLLLSKPETTETTPLQLLVLELNALDDTQENKIALFQNKANFLNFNRNTIFDPNSELYSKEQRVKHLTPVAIDFILESLLTRKRCSPYVSSKGVMHQVNVFITPLNLTGNFDDEDFSVKMPVVHVSDEHDMMVEHPDFTMNDLAETLVDIANGGDCLKTIPLLNKMSTMSSISEAKEDRPHIKITYSPYCLLGIDAKNDTIPLKRNIFSFLNAHFGENVYDDVPNFFKLLQCTNRKIFLKFNDEELKYFLSALRNGDRITNQKYSFPVEKSVEDAASSNFKTATETQSSTQKPSSVPRKKSSKDSSTGHTPNKTKPDIKLKQLACKYFSEGLHEIGSVSIAYKSDEEFEIVLDQNVSVFISKDALEDDLMAHFSLEKLKRQEFFVISQYKSAILKAARVHSESVLFATFENAMVTVKDYNGYFVEYENVNRFQTILLYSFEKTESAREHMYRKLLSVLDSEDEYASLSITQMNENAVDGSIKNNYGFSVTRLGSSNPFEKIEYFKESCFDAFDFARLTMWALDCDRNAYKKPSESATKSTESSRLSKANIPKDTFEYFNVIESQSKSFEELKAEIFKHEGDALQKQQGHGLPGTNASCISVIISSSAEQKEKFAYRKGNYYNLIKKYLPTVEKKTNPSFEAADNSLNFLFYQKNYAHEDDSRIPLKCLFNRINMKFLTNFYKTRNTQGVPYINVNMSPEDDHNFKIIRQAISSTLKSMLVRDAHIPEKSEIQSIINVDPNFREEIRRVIEAELDRHVLEGALKTRFGAGGRLFYLAGFDPRKISPSEFDRLMGEMQQFPQKTAPRESFFMRVAFSHQDMKEATSENELNDKSTEAHQKATPAKKQKISNATATQLKISLTADKNSMKKAIPGAVVPDTIYLEKTPSIEVEELKNIILERLIRN